MNIAFCSSEVYPFAKTGGLGDVCGALPLALERKGVHPIVFLPRYKNVDAKKFNLQKTDQGNYKGRLGKAIDVYFIENNKFFNRDGLYGDARGEYPDNFERFHFFCKESLKIMMAEKLSIDLVHCHDWHTALIPVYLKNDKDFIKKSGSPKSILTIHNMAYQGSYPLERFKKLGLKIEASFFELYGKLNLLKAGIIFSDAVTTVSGQYAREILTHEFGYGLEAILKKEKKDVSGILNGIDYDIWNPGTDTLIEKNYSAENYQEGKKANKSTLQKLLKLPVKPRAPLFGVVGRLSYQKGIDLILNVIPELVKWDGQLVIQGIGDENYEKASRHIQNQYPEHVKVCLEFDEKIAHQIYAGSDLFLMPSRYEPCGLSQMISLCYGTIPVVYKTGGLADTIKEFNAKTLKGNGIVFDQYTKPELLNAIKRALKYFQDEKSRQALIANAFACDFSWERSADEYKKVYQWLS